MFSLNASDSYYLCASGVDLRKGFNALCGVVRTLMGRNPLSGDVYIFLNSTRTSIKLLHWEHGGLVIYHKRLEQGRFELPLYDYASGSYSMSWQDLVLMVQGISTREIKYKKRYNKMR